MRKIVLAALCCVACPYAATAANVTINFAGAENGRSVVGSLTYDPDAVPDFVDSYEGYNVAQYFPNSQLAFTSNGFQASDFYRLAVADAYTPNTEGATDGFLGAVIRGGSGREQFGVQFDYENLTSLTSTQLLARFPRTLGSFYYDYAGEGYRIPITFSYAPVSGTVPEPATWASMVIGIGIAGGFARNRRKKMRVTLP
jgi:hypothetical protein